jgi:hypothetical protein
MYKLIFRTDRWVSMYKSKSKMRQLVTVTGKQKEASPFMDVEAEKKYLPNGNVVQ